MFSFRNTIGSLCLNGIIHESTFSSCGSKKREATNPISGSELYLGFFEFGDLFGDPVFASRFSFQPFTVLAFPPHANPNQVLHRAAWPIRRHTLLSPA